MARQRFKQESETDIEIRFFPTAVCTASPETEKHRLLFVKSGSLQAAGPNGRATVAESQFTCLAGRYEYTFRTAAGTSIVFVYFDDEFFQEYAAQQLDAPAEPAETDHRGLPVCRIQPHLHEFLQAFCQASPEIRSHATYQRLKRNELFFLLGFYYPPGELAQLFRPFFGRESDFRQQVVLHHRQVATVAELGKVLGYSQSTLNRLFHRTFGMAAYQWMQQQKARQVKTCLADRGISLQSIRSRFGFTSPSHLTKFCKTYFGAAPSELRKTAAAEKTTGKSDTHA